MRNNLQSAVPTLALALLLAGTAVGQSTPSKKSTTPKPQTGVQTPATPATQAAAPANSTPIKRLILTDGSYQGVIKYEIVGNRIRYLSSERYTWEEMPKELVDWAATEKYAKEHASGQVSPQGRAVDEEEAKDRAQDDAMTPTVSPGLKLPLNGGVYLLDVYQGKPALSEIVQNGSEVNAHTGGNIFRSTINPLASNKRTVELKGAHARIQSHVSDPFLYVNIDNDQDEKTGPKADEEQGHFRIIKLEEKPNLRIVDTINRAVYGKVKHQAKVIETNVEVVQGGPWIKIIPAEKLEPGEYALVELLGDGMNTFVWDFGMNPTAPENPGTWKPEPPKPNLSSEDNSLKPRPKP
jgi:hypothetical protein